MLSDIHAHVSIPLKVKSLDTLGDYVGFLLHHNPRMNKINWKYIGKPTHLPKLSLFKQTHYHLDSSLLQYIGAYIFSQLGMVFWQTYRSRKIKEKNNLSWNNQAVLICICVLNLGSIMSVDAMRQFLPSDCFTSSEVTQRCLVSSLYPIHGILSGED